MRSRRRRAGVESHDTHSRLSTAAAHGAIRLDRRRCLRSFLADVLVAGMIIYMTTYNGTLDVNDVYQQLVIRPYSVPTPSSAAATGSITCATKANLVDGETVTVGDGLAAPRVFELDVAGDGVAGTNVQVNVSTDTTAADVAARLATAITANVPALSVVDNADGTLSVTHKWSGAGGSVPISDTVAHASFLVSGMAGGIDANAPATATATFKLFTATGPMRLDAVEFIPSASLADDASNYWQLAILRGTTPMSSWSTATAAQGALVAGTPITLVNATDPADRVFGTFGAGDVISFKATKVGTPPPLAAGHGTLRLRTI